MKQFDKTQTMVEKMVAEGDTPFDFTVFLRIKGDSVQQVNEICKDLDDSFVSMGIQFSDGVFRNLWNYLTVQLRFYMIMN